MFEVALISGGRNWADSSHAAVWKIFAALKSSGSCHYLFATEILGNSDNSTFFFLPLSLPSWLFLWALRTWTLDLNDSVFFLPPPVLFSFRCWACSAPAWCCAGGLMTRRTSCWSRPTATRERGCSHPKGSTQNPPKAASLDESTVDFCCSWTTSDTPCTLHDRITNTAHVVWVEGGFRGNSCYLLTCFTNYCYFQCSFFHENICGSQISTWLINIIQVEVLTLILI